jgi:hypothetical protein
MGKHGIYPIQPGGTERLGCIQDNSDSTISGNKFRRLLFLRMIQRTLASLPLWQFEKLAEYPQISHFISGRPGGVSSGEVGALNLSFSARDARENVLENRRRLAEAVGVSARELFFPSQTHSNHVQLVRSGTRTLHLRHVR